jgi:hypothetical protein
MKWLGGISYQQLMDLPDEYYKTMLEMIQEEVDELESR